MARQRKAKSDGPRWRELMLAADRRIIETGGYTPRVGNSSGSVTGADANIAIAAEIVAHGDAAEFLKAVRRGRPTQRQNMRYQLLREVERLAGDSVKRRRPMANTPDALALKKPATFELFGG